LVSKADLNNKFKEWINIFRIDDFVGTDVREADKSWPENIAVDAGGYTGYWTDKQVLKILNTKIIKS